LASAISHDTNPEALNADERAEKAIGFSEFVVSSASAFARNLRESAVTTGLASNIEYGVLTGGGSVNII